MNKLIKISAGGQEDYILSFRIKGDELELSISIESLRPEDFSKKEENLIIITLDYCKFRELISDLISSRKLLNENNQYNIHVVGILWSNDDILLEVDLVDNFNNSWINFKIINLETEDDLEIGMHLEDYLKAWNS